MKTWQEILSESNTQFKPANMVKPGDKGEDYAGHKGKVIKIVKIDDWKSVDKYDKSNWMDDKQIKNYKEDGIKYVVAVSDDNGDNVFAYDEDGWMAYK